MVDTQLKEGSRDNRKTVIKEAFREAGLTPGFATTMYANLKLADYRNGVAHTEGADDELILVVSVPTPEYGKGREDHVDPTISASFTFQFERTARRAALQVTKTTVADGISSIMLNLAQISAIGQP